MVAQATAIEDGGKGHGGKGKGHGNSWLEAHAQIEEAQAKASAAEAKATVAKAEGHGDSWIGAKFEKFEAQLDCCNLQISHLQQMTTKLSMVIRNSHMFPMQIEEHDHAPHAAGAKGKAMTP